MNRRISLLAAAALVPAALTVTAPAQAGTSVSRATTLSTQADPGGDFVLARHKDGLTYATAKKADLRSVKVTHGLRNGTDAIAFTLKVNTVALTGRHQQVFNGHVMTGSTITGVHYNRATGKKWVTRGTKIVSCNGVAVTKTTNTVTLVAPRRCLTSGQSVQVRGTTAVTSGGVQRMIDAARWSKKVSLSSQSLRSFTFAEKTGDVTFVGDPAASNYAGESIDLTSATYASDQHGVAVAAGIADASYYSWDVKQRFHLDWVGTDGKVHGTLTITPNRTEDGTVTVTGEDALTGCASVASFTVTTDKGLTGRIPTSCLSGSSAAFRIRSESLTEADEVTGSDTTGLGKAVLIG